MNEKRQNSLNATTSASREVVGRSKKYLAGCPALVARIRRL
jgi:hypothetical protein